MERYRVTYQRFEKHIKVTGSIIVEVESKNDIPKIFYSELKNRFVENADNCEIANIKNMNDVVAFRQKIKDSLIPVALTPDHLKHMMDFKNHAFYCTCYIPIPFKKIKLFDGLCPDQHLFICKHCEQIYLIREKAVSFFLKGKSIDFAYELEELIPKNSTFAKRLKTRC